MNVNQIKDLRQELGLNQQKFAERVGVSMSTVARWELGLQKPSPLAVAKLNKIKEETEQNARRKG